MSLGRVWMPFFGKRYLSLSAGSLIGRVSGLWVWPCVTPPMDHCVRVAPPKAFGDQDELHQAARPIPDGKRL